MRFVKPGEATKYADRLRKRILDRKKELCLSYNNLAELAGLARSTVAAFCLGVRGGDIYTLYSLCAALGLQFERIEEDSDFEDS